MYDNKIIRILGTTACMYLNVYSIMMMTMITNILLGKPHSFYNGFQLFTDQKPCDNKITWCNYKLFTMQTFKELRT